LRKNRGRAREEFAEDDGEAAPIPDPRLFVLSFLASSFRGKSAKSDWPAGEKECSEQEMKN
jgi:hypothetical protein